MCSYIFHFVLKANRFIHAVISFFCLQEVPACSASSTAPFRLSQQEGTRHLRHDIRDLPFIRHVTASARVRDPAATQRKADLFRAGFRPSRGNASNVLIALKGKFSYSLFIHYSLLLLVIHPHEFKLSS